MTNNPLAARPNVQITPTKYGYTFSISREFAVDMGLLQPTPEERAEQQRQSAVYRERAARHVAAVHKFRDTLNLVGEPHWRAILDLHTPSPYDHPECQGCDVEGYEGEQPEWPCRTVRLVAEKCGIHVPKYGEETA
jgi:hypothetical protein